MAKPSYRSLIDTKIIKRTDNGMAINPRAIRIKPGFNLRDVNAEDYEADIEALTAHIINGGKYPALEVVLSADGGGVDIVDGHRRFAAIERAIERGAPIVWVRIEPFEGDEVQRTARIMSSNEGRKLLPLEIAEGYRRLKAFGLAPEQIAAMMGKTRQHVDQMLILANAPHDVKTMVKTGDVSASTAVQQVRQHGEAAVTKLKDAKAQGGKVTAKALKPWTPPAKFVAPVITTLDQLHAALPAQTRMDLLNEPKDGATVSVPARFVWELMNQHDAITQQRESDAQKARDKAARANHPDLAATGTDGA
jgi:ParB family transcriptional regulator, chromosome partitioning protein